MTKEQHDGQHFIRYCFLRNGKYKYVHIGDAESCGKNIELLGEDMMVYDSRKQLKLFYYIKFKAEESIALNLEIYTDQVKAWRVKEMTKCINDNYLVVLADHKSKSKFCLCILKKTQNSLEQLSFCKVQITGEDESQNFSKLTVVGND